MKRFLIFLSFLGLLYFTWPVIEGKIENSDVADSLQQMKAEIDSVAKDPQTIAIIDSVSEGVQQVLQKLEGQQDEQPLKAEKQAPKEKTSLKTPTSQLFSVHNLELGDTKGKVERIVGKATRSTMNEYGSYWHTYHDNYQNFLMVMFNKNNKIAGLYTNQDLIASKIGIKLGTPKADVRSVLGNPLTKIQKGLTIYQLDQNSDYDVFLKDDTYVTVFYDKHEKNTVTALQLITKEMEQQKADFYTNPSPALKEGFEYQLFDLTNAARVEHGLPILTWDNKVRKTAREHSTDMAEHDYFDHTNLQGQSPFDRMKEDHIIFYLAGENLAYGQLSSIFAHEGLMNSLGHRENILRKGYEFLGVGVAFNQQSQPYYTENFYAK
ncbi:CAP domain-containing protein [Bacillus rubiinfantis]|uniref:CAP domain-containing protein n=1 Tax=Bacillus rubiinfantis TaxID=1499680 RepID=UPI0005A6DBC7|nr:CAP domain-containing protein [Bacillus rubiinfantis]